MTRVVVVGLDSGDWDVIQLLRSQGQLPHLDDLFRRGAVCRLSDRAQPGRVWTRVLVGRWLRSTTRVADLGFDPATYRAFQLEALWEPPFFTTEPAIPTIALDVPYVSLPAGPEEVRVNGWGTHTMSTDRESFPAPLLAEIDDRFGVHPASSIEHAARWFDPNWIDALATALAEGARRRLEIGLWLQARFPEWALFFTVMSEPHSAGEAFWHGMAPGPLAATPTAGAARTRLGEVYGALDAAIGHFVSQLPPETVVVVFSLQGSAPNYGDVPSMVLLPELLHRLQLAKPFLRLSPPEGWAAAGFPPVVPDTTEDWHHWLRERLAPSASLKLSRPSGDDADAGAGDRHETSLSIDWQVPTWYRDRWPLMRAFALPSFADGRIRINLEGRERWGIVPKGDYEHACARVEASVRACRDPRTGRSVVTDVQFPRAQDPFDPDASDADVVIKWAPWVDAFDHPDVGTLGPVPLKRPGGHIDRGFALVCGPGIPPGDLGERDAGDLAPTVLALLGHPGAAALEGTPIVSTPEATRERGGEVGGTPR